MIRPWPLFFLLGVAFLFGPIPSSPRDEIPVEIVSESVLSGRGFHLSFTDLSQLPPDYVEVSRQGRHVLAPAAVAQGIVALPFSVAVRILYPHADAVDRARRAGRLAGAFYTAGAVALTFAALLRLTPPSIALLLSLAAAFASPLYSTASRSSNLHAPAALGIAFMLWLAVGDGAWRAVARGAVTAGLYFLRPACLLAPAALLASLGRGIRSSSSPDGLRAAIFGLVLAAFPLALLQGAITGEPRWGWPDPVAIAAYLVSPGRAVLLFAPVALLAGIALAVTRQGDEARLVRACALVVFVALVEIACFHQWWGGFGFGPHLLTAYVPLLTAMAAFAPPRVIRLSPFLFLPVAVLHATFVFRGGHLWDERRRIDDHPEVVWDVRDSPFRDLFLGAPPPDPAGLDPAVLALSVGDHVTGLPSADRPAENQWLVRGWEGPEPEGIWASGQESWIAVALPGPGDYTLTLSAAAPIVRGRHQRLEISVPGAPPQVHEFSGGPWDYEPVRIHVPYRPGVVIVQLRPGHVWVPGRGDLRRCTFFLRGLRLDRSG